MPNVQPEIDGVYKEYYVMNRLVTLRGLRSSASPWMLRWNRGGSGRKRVLLSMVVHHFMYTILPYFVGDCGM